VAGWAVAWFVLSPFTLAPGARLHISGRALGELLVTTYFIGLVLFVSEHTASTLLFCSLSGALVLLVSVFATQVLVAFSVITAAWLLDVAPLTALAAAFVGAYVISFGAYRNVLSGHFRHSQFYFQVIQDRHSSTLDRRWLFNLESSRTAFRYSIGA